MDYGTETKITMHTCITEFNCVLSVFEKPIAQPAQQLKGPEPNGRHMSVKVAWAAQTTPDLFRFTLSWDTSLYTIHMQELLLSSRSDRYWH